MPSHHKGKDIGVLQSAKIISYCTIVILAPDTVMHNLPCGRLHMISLGPVAGVMLPSVPYGVQSNQFLPHLGEFMKEVGLKF